MFLNDFRIGIRNLSRQKGYTLLNIFGLALGLTAAILILAFVRVDLTWDQFHKNIDNIYRVVELQNFGGTELTDVAVTMPPLGPMLAEELPQVEEILRISRRINGVANVGDRSLYIENVGIVDSSFFDFFSFPLLEGNSKTALNRSDGFILTEKTAAALFPDENAMGRTLEFDGIPRTVTGIIGEFPVNTQIHFDALAAIDAKSNEKFSEQWNSNNLSTYLMVTPGTNIAALDTSITAAYHRHGDWNKLIFYVQPLKEMHLYSSQIEIDINPGKSDIRAVYTLISLAILILLIASINFVNLATARSVRRAREVGLRKVVGAGRGSLILQFLGESLLLSLLAMIVAAIAIQLLLPVFRNIVGREVPLHLFDGGFATYTLLGLTLLTGILSGLYPAFILSSFKPSQIFRSSGTTTTSGGVFLRRALVTFQFAITIGLLIATGVIYRQAQYIRNKPLGYDREHVLVLPLRSNEATENASALRDMLLTVPDVVSASIATRTPTNGGSQSGMTFEGEEKSRMTNYILCDENYANVMSLEMAEGRFFEAGHPADLVKVESDSVISGTIVVNEAAVRKAGWDNPIGKTVEYNGHQFPVVGVVKDFHFQSLYTEITPLVFVDFPSQGYLISLRYRSDNTNELLRSIESKWDEWMPNLPFDYFFLDDDYNRYYHQQLHQATLLESFSGIAIIIATLGLVGLVSYATERRTREIGVRKVLGASVAQILRLMTREFLLLVVIANVIAWPAAGFIMLRWLQDFAYRVPLAWWLFPMAGLIVFALSWLVMIAVTWRSAQTNPAEALRYE